MTPEHVASLCAFIEAAGGGRIFNEYTVRAWTSILSGDVDYTEATAAVVRLKQTPGRFPTVSTEDIFGMLRTMARERTALDVAGVDQVIPNVDPDDPRAYAAEHRAIIAAVARGDFPHGAYLDGGWTMTGAPPLRAAGELAAAAQWAGQAPRAIDAAAMGEVFRRPPRPTRDNYVNAIEVAPHMLREPEAPLADVILLEGVIVERSA